MPSESCRAGGLFCCERVFVYRRRGSCALMPLSLLVVKKGSGPAYMDTVHRYRVGRLARCYIGDGQPVLFVAGYISSSTSPFVHYRRCDSDSLSDPGTPPDSI